MSIRLGTCGLSFVTLCLSSTREIVGFSIRIPRAIRLSSTDNPFDAFSRRRLGATVVDRECVVSAANSPSSRALNGPSQRRYSVGRPVNG